MGNSTRIRARTGCFMLCTSLLLLACGPASPPVAESADIALPFAADPNPSRKHSQGMIRSFFNPAQVRTL